MFVGLPYVRAGVGLSLIYDESTGIVVEQLIDKESAQVSYEYEPSKISKRFSPGFLGKLEIPMGYISGFADVGYIFSRTEGFYSTMCANIGAKTYVYKGFNASFGVQMVPSRKANCTFISLGYSFNHHSVIRRWLWGWLVVGRCFSVNFLSKFSRDGVLLLLFVYIYHNI